MSKNKIIIIFLLVLFNITLTSCTSTDAVVELLDTPIAISSPTVVPSTSTPTMTPNPPTATPIPYTSLSSPLQNISLEEIDNINTNPFNPPPIGFDESHQGIDYSYYRFENSLMVDNDGIEGLPILAVLDGRVSTVLFDRFPYGNAIIIETDLKYLPQAWKEKIFLPEIAPTIIPDPRHNCPPLVSDPTWDMKNRSLYFIYAHLLYPPQNIQGEKIHSGQQIGEVGNTGRSSNPHLHLELRLGPSNATFSSMAKYDTRASQEDISNYCIWRISNLFQLLDPNIILKVNNN